MDILKKEGFDDSFEILSIGELTKLLHAKCMELPEEEAVTIKLAQTTIIEKEGLIRLCKRCIDENDIARLMNTDMAPRQSESILTSPMLIEEDEATKRKKESFTSRISLAAFDDGHSLRGMLHKKGRGRNSFIRPWTERFVILDYSLLTLRYWDISASTARTLNLDSTLPSEKDLKGEIDIQGCTIEPLSAAVSGMGNSFRILKNDEEMITLATPTAEESQEWINKLLLATGMREKEALEARRKIAEGGAGIKAAHKDIGGPSKHSAVKRHTASDNLPTICSIGTATSEVRAEDLRETAVARLRSESIGDSVADSVI